MCFRVYSSTGTGRRGARAEGKEVEVVRALHIVLFPPFARAALMGSELYTVDFWELRSEENEGACVHPGL